MSAAHTSHAAPRRRRRRDPVPVLVLLLVAAVALIWYYTRDPAPAPSGDAGGQAGQTGTTVPDPGPGPGGDDTPDDPGPAGQEDGEPPVEPTWELRLVNWENSLPEDFVAPALTQLRNGQAIDSRAYPSLQAMMDAARAEGLQPLICSSFRTWETQERLFRNKLQSCLDRGMDQEAAQTEAARWVAPPGTSEHQLGLAVDIVDVSYQILDEGQEDTAVQKWLMEHCWEYGFILRYPTDKSDVTHIGYEPWHYRYVGAETALKIRDSGLCLEEYLAQ